MAKLTMMMTMIKLTIDIKIMMTAKNNDDQNNDDDDND